MKKIKAEMLTREAFAPFGEVLTPEGRKDCGVPGSHTWFPDVVVREEPTCVNLMEVFRKEFICQKFEAHNHTEETLFAMTGGILIPFAKNRENLQKTSPTFSISRKGQESPADRASGTGHRTHWKNR